MKNRSLFVFILLFILFIFTSGCELLLDSNSVPETPNDIVLIPSTSSIKVIIVPSEKENELDDKFYRVYYSSRIGYSLHELILHAQISENKKEAGWKDFLSPQGTIHDLLESTKYYITVIVINKNSLFESEPTPIKTATTTAEDNSYTVFKYRTIDALIINSVVSNGDVLTINFTSSNNLGPKANGEEVSWKDIVYMVFISNIPPKNNDPNILVDNTDNNYSYKNVYKGKDVTHASAFAWFDHTIKEGEEASLEIKGLKNNTEFYVTIFKIARYEDEVRKSRLAAVKSGKTSP